MAVMRVLGFLCSVDFFKILCAMLTQRADEVGGKGFALIDIAADAADIAGFLRGSGAGFGLICF